MITHLIKSINWVDAALIFLFLRIIFTGVTNGFLSEFFKLLGVVTAVFVSLHFYSSLAAYVAEKVSFSIDCCNVAVFAGLWLVVMFFFKLLRSGILVLFKAETNHQGFYKYAAGIVAVGRGILVCSLTIFLVLLVNNGPLTRMTFYSYSYKIAGRASVDTYSFLYKNLIDKFFVGEHYNAAVAQVLHPDGDWPKERK